MPRARIRVSFPPREKRHGVTALNGIIESLARQGLKQLSIIRDLVVRFAEVSFKKYQSKPRTDLGR